MTASTTQPAAPVVVREAGPGDLNFILKSWLMAVRNTSHLSWGIANARYFAGEQILIKRTLAKARTLVACLPDDPELVLGFVVCEPPALCHFVYVKAALRRQGVARVLLQAAGLDPVAGFVATVATYELTKGFIREKYPAVEFDPYPRLTGENR